jgi:hypothetical protein
MATLEAIRERVLRARAQAVARHEDEIVRELDGALAEIESGETLLTTSEAAAKLGIRSVNTIKAMVHAGQIHAGWAVDCRYTIRCSNGGNGSVCSASR